MDPQKNNAQVSSGADDNTTPNEVSVDITAAQSADGAASTDTSAPDPAALGSPAVDAAVDAPAADAPTSDTVTFTTDSSGTVQAVADSAASDPSSSAPEAQAGTDSPAVDAPEVPAADVSAPSESPSVTPELGATPVPAPIDPTAELTADPSATAPVPAHGDKKTIIILGVVAVVLVIAIGVLFFM